MKIKPRNCNCLKSPCFKHFTRSISELLHHSVTKQYKSESNTDSKSGSNLCFSTVKISILSCKTS